MLHEFLQFFGSLSPPGQISGGHPLQLRWGPVVQPGQQGQSVIPVGWPLPKKAPITPESSVKSDRSIVLSTLGGRATRREATVMMSSNVSSLILTPRRSPAVGRRGGCGSSVMGLGAVGQRHGQFDDDGFHMTLPSCFPRPRAAIQNARRSRPHPCCRCLRRQTRHWRG